MISILIICHKKNEADILQQLCGYCTALMSNETLICEAYSEEERLTGLRRTWDMLLFEADTGEDLSVLRELREQLPEASLLLIAGADLVPEQYVTPHLYPSMLLRKPFDRQKAFDAVRQLLAGYYRRRERESAQRLMIRRGDNRRYFHYTQILFLEAKEKKLILYSEQEELAFYGSLREMEKVLPKYFIRCHRSYIVNSMHISRLNLSQGILHVEEKFVIPISRRYKSKVGIQLADSVEMSENRQSQTNIPADDSERHSAGRRGRTKET